MSSNDVDGSIIIMAYDVDDTIPFLLLWQKKQVGAMKKDKGNHHLKSILSCGWIIITTKPYYFAFVTISTTTSILFFSLCFVINICLTRGYCSCLFQKKNRESSESSIPLCLLFWWCFYLSLFSVFCLFLSV